MDNAERKGYRALFDDTKKFIKRGEEREKALKEAQPSQVTDALLASTTKILEELREEADEREKLGWDNENGGTSS
jgi:hypothetical protein